MLTQGMTLRIQIVDGFEYIYIKNIDSKTIEYYHFVCSKNQYSLNNHGNERAFSDFYQAVDDPKKINVNNFEIISKNIFNRAVLQVVLNYQNFTTSRLWDMYETE
jgi:hypothetical protein